ncbi:MBL fold metallo-hydrolase [Candidatus Nomurabacteria bacterium]|nr:MBL fold metallo-hydrolase [Candidatus Nomurabacteria bacterium]
MIQKKKVFVLAIVLFILASLGIALIWYGNKNTYENDEQKVRIAFLDIGQGDATLIDFPDGSQMLIDCSKDARVLEALSRNMHFWDRHINTLVITHPDFDHYGGCEDVIERFEVDKIIYTGYPKDNQTWNSLVETATAKGLWYTPMREYIEQSHLQSQVIFLYPNDSVDIFDTKAIDSNESSIVTKISIGSSDALLMGDAEIEVEELLMHEYGDQIDIEVLKVGHHGSAGGTGEAFLDAVTPQYAVISAGAGNSYGHPSARVLKKLERAHSQVLRTDLLGDIILEMTETDIYVK